ncbi:hypothetical protein GCM10020331_089590 [Ectobacillus funiculus]
MLLQKTTPDYIEVLPGALTQVITEIHEKTGIPIIAGGFIRTVADIERALQAGAAAITTSNTDLWKKKYGEFTKKIVKVRLTSLTSLRYIRNKLI